jgi:CDGSH-type Zn-finger protein
MRHLPTMVGFPQPAIADSKTARMMIRNQALRRAEVNGMTTGISSCVGVITTVNNLATHFDAKKFVCFREANYVLYALQTPTCVLAHVTLCVRRAHSLSPLGLLAFFLRLPSAMRRVLKSDKRPLEIKPQQESVWICMCGLSKNQPFCDGSHKTTRDEEDGKTYDYDSEGHRHEV